MRKKTGKTVILLAAFVLCMTAALAAGCGKKENKESALAGSCEEILEKVYADAALDADMRESMEYYQTVPVDEAQKEFILGTADIDYTDSVYSAPMMSSVAYQCVLLRVSGDQDVEAAKESLTANADPRKWVCVEAESVVVENVGDVILFLMADEATADAVKAAFLALGE